MGTSNNKLAQWVATSANASSGKRKPAEREWPHQISVLWTFYLYTYCDICTDASPVKFTNLFFLSGAHGGCLSVGSNMTTFVPCGASLVKVWLNLTNMWQYADSCRQMQLGHIQFVLYFCVLRIYHAIPGKKQGW